MIGKRKKIVLIISVLLLPAAFLIFNSCYKDYDLSTADYDTVFTA